MASILKVDTIQDQDGNNIINESANTITIGASGDTISIPSNVGIGTSSPSTNLDISSSGDATINLKASGQANGLQLSQLTADGGSSISATNNNYLKFSTNATERMRIDSSGNVGIGTTSPGARLHVYKGSSGGTINSSTDDLVIESNTTAGINILTNSGNGANGVIYFGDENDNNAGRIIYVHSTNQFSFGTNGAERMILDSSGNVGIGTTSPTGQLQIYNASGTGGIRLTRLDNITDINMHLQTNSTSTLLNFYGDAVFRTNVKGDGTNAIERMRIDSSGDVLVATTTNGSKAKLHAEGSMGIGAERFDTHEIGKGASGTYTTITTTFTATSGAGSVIVEALMTGYSGVYLDHVIGKYSTQANQVMRNNASGGTTVTLTESSSVYTHTITTSVLHPVVKYKITVGGLAFFTVAPTITFA